MVVMLRLCVLVYAWHWWLVMHALLTNSIMVGSLYARMDLGLQPIWEIPMPT